MIIAFGLFGAVVVFWLSSLNWRASIKAAMTLLILEGVLRKWVLPQASELIYFLKDGILLGAYTGCIQKGEWQPSLRAVSQPLQILIGCITFLLLLQIFNPTARSIIVGLLGVKSYLLYVPVCLLGSRLFRTSNELHSFLRWYLLLIIPACLLGIAQFYAPADSPINMYAESAQAMLGADERGAEVFGEDSNVRVTSTFPFLWGYSTYLTACVSLVFAILVHQRSVFWMAASGIELLLLFINIFMTGARSLALSAAMIVVAFFGFSLFESNRNKKLAFIMIAAACVCVPITLKWFSEPVDAFFSRTDTAGDSFFDRTLAPLLVEPWVNLDKAGLTGFGPAATQAAGFVLRDRLSLGVPESFPPYSEYEPLRTLLELGPLGLIGWFALKGYIAVALARVCFTLRTPLLRSLGVAAFTVDFLWFFTNSLVFNPTCGVLYWFLAGFAFVLPRLDRMSGPPGRARARDSSRRTKSSEEALALSDVANLESIAT